MKRRRGWGYAALVCVAILLVGLAIGFARGFNAGQTHPEKYDWTYVNGEGYPPEVTAAINMGATGMLAAAGVCVVYLVAFGTMRKRSMAESEEVAEETRPPTEAQV